VRLLHTSDWHLGRSFHRVSLLDAQRAFLDHLVATVREERVDAVLVAGDIYDRAVPPLSAVELFDDALHQLAESGVPTVMISGNHDSARRLGVNSALIDASGVHLRTRPAALADPVLLADDHGEVAVYGVPYLEPALARPAAPAEAPGKHSHEAVLGEAVNAIRADAAARGAARAVAPRTVVMAHAWVAGGASEEERRQDAERHKSASERDISVGGIGYVPASLFTGFSYVALGHLHGRQVLAEHMRYSGSPLPYSFSEKDHRKGSWLVEVDAGGQASAEWVPAPVYRRLAALAGRLDDLLTAREHDGR
jgi:exonuclease SbcD